MCYVSSWRLSSAGAWQTEKQISIDSILAAPVRSRRGTFSHQRNVQTKNEFLL
jgi:hypothetical protein